MPSLKIQQIVDNNTMDSYSDFEPENIILTLPKLSDDKIVPIIMVRLLQIIRRMVGTGRIPILTFITLSY